MVDDVNVVSARIINEQLQGISPSKFGFTHDIHVNETTSGPSHNVEQGTITLSDEPTFESDFVFTANAAHVTEIVDTVLGSSRFHSVYTGEGTSYNIVQQSWINGVSQGVVHIQS